MIDANVSDQTLDVDPGNGGLTNAGLMEATNGGTLQINGNSGQGFTNTGAGTMRAMDGSTVLVDEASITGGTLSTSGTGLIQIYRGTDASGFTNVTSTGALFVDGTVDLTGTFTNRGAVTFGTNGGNGGITIATVGNVTLNGGGTITMTSGSDIAGAGGTLTNVDNTIQGFSGLGSDQVAIVNGLGGIINANVSGQTLDVDPGAGGLTNAGLMEATNGGTLQINFNNEQGFTNRGEYRVNDGSTITAPQGGISKPRQRRAHGRHLSGALHRQQTDDTRLRWEQRHDQRRHRRVEWSQLGLCRPRRAERQPWQFLAARPAAVRHDRRAFQRG